MCPLDCICPEVAFKLMLALGILVPHQVSRELIQSKAGFYSSFSFSSSVLAGNRLTNVE